QGNLRLMPVGGTRSQYGQEPVTGRSLNVPDACIVEANLPMRLLLPHIPHGGATRVVLIILGGDDYFGRIEKGNGRLSSRPPLTRTTLLPSLKVPQDGRLFGSYECQEFSVRRLGGRGSCPCQAIEAGDGNLLSRGKLPGSKP